MKITLINIFFSFFLSFFLSVFFFVQMQFPEDGLEQWILDETCASEDSYVTVARCGVATDRLVQAYVIDLNTEEMHLGKIRVNSCVGYV